MSVNAIPPPRSEAPPALRRWYVLIVMCAVYAINIAARYVVTTVFEPIRLELHLTDAGAAFLTGIPLALFYVVFGIPIAWLADRSNRRNIVAASLILWSALTVFCGLAQTYWQLLLGRVGVGLGEAGATPPSSSIVSDCFPAARRPMALSIFALGAPFGTWLGADLAGAVAQEFGWRAAFLALGAPGLLLGLLVFLTVREPARGRLDAMAGEGNPSLLVSLQFLWRQKAAFHVMMAAGVCCLWGWGLAWWTPTFLMRTYALDVAQAGAITGHVHLVGGILATAGTAWLLSRPCMANPRRVLWTLAIVIGFATLPSFLAYWTQSLWVAKAALWTFIPAIYFFIGPSMALVLNCAPANMRSIFTAWLMLVGNIFNLIVAPQAVGIMSDWFAAGRATDSASLRLALLVLAPTGFWAVWHYFRAARTVIADERRAIGYATA